MITAFQYLRGCHKDEGVKTILQSTRRQDKKQQTVRQERKAGRNEGGRKTERKGRKEGRKTITPQKLVKKKLLGLVNNNHGQSAHNDGEKKDVKAVVGFKKNYYRFCGRGLVGVEWLGGRGLVGMAGGG
ncbi:hypothetical protein L345_14921, partial [Ophiophagus hannah]